MLSPDTEGVGGTPAPSSTTPSSAASTSVGATATTTPEGTLNSTTSSTTSKPKVSPAWKKLVDEVSAITGKKKSAISTALLQLVGTRDKKGIELLRSADCTESNLLNALTAIGVDAENAQKAMTVIKGATVAKKSASTAPSAAWSKAVGEVASIIGKPTDTVSSAMAELVGDSNTNDNGLAMINSPDCLEDNIITALKKCGQIPVVLMNRAVRSLKGGTTQTTVASATMPAQNPLQNIMATAAAGNTGRRSGLVIPDLPEISSVLDKLKIDGVSKVSSATVEAALAAYFAIRADILEAPVKLLEIKKNRALNAHEPFTQDIYDLEKMIGRRQFGHILKHISKPMKYLASERREEFVRNIHRILSLIKDVKEKVIVAQNNYTTQRNNGGLAGLLDGRSVRPNTTDLKDACTSFITQTNEIFAGDTILATQVLAAEVKRVEEILNDPNLYKSLGAVNREAMLLNVGITATAAKGNVDKNVRRLVYRIYEAVDIFGGAGGVNLEIEYLEIMYDIAANISIDDLLSKPPLPIIEPSNNSGRNGAERAHRPY